jgi:hypothetical protein
MESVTVDTPAIPHEVRQCKKTLQIMAAPVVEDVVPEAFILEPAEIVLFI